MTCLPKLFYMSRTRINITAPFIDNRLIAMPGQFQRSGQAGRPCADNDGPMGQRSYSGLNRRPGLFFQAPYILIPLAIGPNLIFISQLDIDSKDKIDMGLTPRIDGTAYDDEFFNFLLPTMQLLCYYLF